MTTPAWLTPDWPAPPNVRAAATLRSGGVSADEYASLNLATHVGDDLAAVATNRRRLREALNLASEPAWLNQVHGITVVEANPQSTPPTADASIAHAANQVCVVMTADCLPVLFCDRGGTRVGAAHAGWRGLVGGVLGETIKAMSVDPQNLLAWLGPAIESAAFEVGEEVRELFVSRNPANIPAFERNARGRWQADIYALAHHELRSLGVTQAYGGGFNVFSDSQRFFSYRRNSTTGRMATMVWLAQ